MKKIVLVALSTLAITTLASCNNKADTSPNYKAGDKIYTKRIIFDTEAEEPENVHFELGDVDGVSEVKIGRAEIPFGFHNGVLTLDGKTLKQVGAKEATVNVTTGKGKRTIEALLATKIIRTVEDYEFINSTITTTGETLEGIYVLGNDINFNGKNEEPIGNYTFEEDPNKHFFHGVFDGDGYALKNLNVSYSSGDTGIASINNTTPDHGISGYPSNYDVYVGNGKFEIPGHELGDNIGVFQVIGSSGVVRNVVFDNVAVHGRTIVGVIAGNNSGTIENCLIKSSCSVLMDTHFWDDDCNSGAIAGIVGAGATVRNVVSLTKNVSVRGTFEDYADKYVGESGADYDHGYHTDNPFWRYWGNNRVAGENAGATDSNGNATNGVYAGVGKCWGTSENSVAAAFNAMRFDQAAAPASFGQTHLAANKASSGDANMGELLNCAVYDVNGLKQASNYSAFDSEVWNIVDGQYPELKENVNAYRIAE